MNKKKLGWVYGLMAMFIVLNTYFISQEKFFFMLIPLVLLVGLMFLFSLDRLLLLIAFLTPLSVNLKDSELGAAISVPAEPLLVGVMILFVIKMLLEGGIDRRVIRHPISLAILFYLFWIGITTLTSTMPWVSVKSLVARLWFIIPMFYLGTQLFRDHRNIRRFVWLYAAGLIVVIHYTVIRHAQFGFNEDIGHYVMRPFYNDHTAYGAMLAFFIPMIAHLAFSKRYSRTMRILAMIAGAYLLSGLFLSFSRAAWISVVGALGVYVLFSLRIKFRWIALSLVTIVLLFFSFQHQIIERLERNKQDSSKDLVEHIRSITNISSDASNLERINRWQSALRMFREKPVWGWGPGTYQFTYAPFQHSKERTIISTNVGDLGNAHSEYIGPLSETGLPGMLSVMLLVVLIIYYGLKMARHGRTAAVRSLSLAASLGLISYFLHGLLNNFLDTDKAAVPFWAFVAIIVSLNVYTGTSGEDEETQADGQDLSV